MQKFLTLVMTGLIVYLVLINSRDMVHTSPQERAAQPKEHTTTTEDAEPFSEANMHGNFVERTVSNVLHNVLKTEEGKAFFENLIKPMDQPLAAQTSLDLNGEDFINSLFKIDSFGEGTGGRASCGHLATIDYKIISIHDVLVKEGTVTIPLGSDKIAPGLDTVVVGMKVGQTRLATIAARYFTKDPKHAKSQFKVQVALKKIVPNNFADDAKIFDDKITYKFPLVCGMKTSYDVRITNLAKDKVVYDSTKKGRINMKLGDLNYPMIFSHALHGKIPVGTRTVMAKGKNLKSYNSDFSAIFPDIKIPENTNYMIEFFNFAE